MGAFDWIITVISGAYVISPIDLIPDFIIGIGWIDDIIVGLIGLMFFIRGLNNDK